MKLSVMTVSPASPKETERNINNAKRLGFPRIGKAETPRLAVVGGGPSIRNHIEQLKEFDGDIWAINGAFQWCRENGIKAWFFSVDPSDGVAKFCSGAKRAFVAMDSHPAVFRALSSAKVEAVELEGLAHGPSTSTSAPVLGLMRGYKEFHFYGCEGSFGETTHAYGDYGLEMLLRVSCNGEQFLTTADMMVQVEYLGEIMKKAPAQFIDKSGGLLAAYIKDPNIHVDEVSPQLYESVIKSHREKDERNAALLEKGDGGAVPAGSGDAGSEDRRNSQDDKWMGQGLPDKGGPPIERRGDERPTFISGHTRLLPLAAKPQGILIALPAGGQMVTSKTTESLFATAQFLTAQKIPNRLMMFSAADIEDIRNLFITQWYDAEPEFSHLLFVDADMGFSPALIRDMIQWDRPLMGVLYARREMPASIVGTVPEGHSLKDVHHGFIRASGLGCGVMMISREVIKTILEKFPELADESEDYLTRKSDGRIKRILRVFEKIRTKELRLSEDMSFCWRWQQCGGEIWANVAHSISHVGPFDYHMRYLGMIEAREQEAKAAA
jgi:hypothetical protein